MYKLRVNPVAYQDLEDIKTYITVELSSPDAADKTLDKIITAYESLLEFPMKGPTLSSKVKIPTDYRFLVCGKYIIFYKVESNYISIYRILNGKRNYISLLFDEVQKEE